MARKTSTAPPLDFLSLGRAAEREPEYLVKWLGRSHMHDEWVPEGLLGRIAKRKLVNFKRRHGDAPCLLADPAWRTPERLVARRPAQAGPGWEVLVKWTGLGYETATWEARARSPPHPCPPARPAGSPIATAGMPAARAGRPRRRRVAREGAPQPRAQRPPPPVAARRPPRPPPVRGRSWCSSLGRAN